MISHILFFNFLVNFNPFEFVYESIISMRKKRRRMNMRVEKHVLTILYKSGEARDSSGMRYIKLQGCMTQSSIDKPLPRFHTLWCDPHGGWRHTLDCKFAMY